MLKAIQKALGVGEAAKPEAEGTGLAVDASAAQAALNELKAEFETYKETAEQMVASYDEQITGLKAELEAATGKLAEVQAEKEAIAAARLADMQDAAAAKLAARKEKLVASLGTERADALLKVTEEMDDAAFEAVVSALGVSAAVEADSPLFKEIGVAAEADAAKVVESAEMRYLKNKYGKK